MAAYNLDIATQQLLTITQREFNEMNTKLIVPVTQLISSIECGEIRVTTQELQAVSNFVLFFLGGFSLLKIAALI